MKNRIKTLCIIFIFIMIMSSCKDGSSGIIDRNSGGNPDIRIMNIHKDGNEIFNSVRANNGRMIYSTMSSSEVLYYYIEELNNLPELPFLSYDISTTDVLDYELDEEGNSYFIILESIDENENIYLRKISTDGNAINIKWLNEFHRGDVDDCYLWKVKIMPNGNIIIYSRLAYCLLDKSGEVIKEDSWEKEEFYDIICLDDDLIFLQHYINGQREVSKVDISTNNIQQIKNIPRDAYFDLVNYTSDTILMYEDSEVYSFDLKTENIESLFKWSDYGIVGDYIIKVYSEDEKLHCIIYDNGSLYDVAWLETDSRKYRTEIVLGCIGEQKEVRNAVAQFNNTNHDYMITVVDYWDEDEKAATNNMYNDILTGKGPDIIRLDSRYINDIMLGEKEVLVDLNPYLDSSSIIKQKDIVESIYQALLFDNKLYMMPTNFVLETMVTKSKWIPETNVWTVDQILDILDENPDLQDTFISKEYMIQYGASYSLGTGWNSENRIVDEDTLKKYLELASRMPDDVVYEPDDSVRRDGKVFFESCIIDSVETYLYKKSAWGEDSAFVGFPGAAGNGMAIIPENCYGISTKSAHKDKAWEFIESFFTDEWQDKITPNYRFSVCNDVLDKQLENSMLIDTYIDGDGNSQEAPILTYFSGGDYVNVYAAREQDIANIRDMINGTKLVRRDVSSILNIIQEEAAYYFAGHKTIDEVINIIKNRINLTLSEG